MYPLPKFLAVATLAVASLLSAQTSSPESDIIPIKSFEALEGFQYTYGTWRAQTQTSNEGIVIAAQSTAKGGGGGGITADISRAQNLFVTLRKLPGHRANLLNIILMDSGGRGAGFVLNLAHVGSEWTVLQLNIARQSFRPPDMQPNPDWSSITGYQIQGTHRDDSPVAVQIREICAAPPPPAATL